MIASDGNVGKNGFRTVPALSVVTTLFFASLTLILLAFGCPYNDWTDCSLFVAVYAACVYAILLFQAFGRTSSLSFYFLILAISYPFFYGRQIVDGLGFEMSRSMLSNDWMGIDTLWTASMVVLLALLFLHMGYCLFAERREPDELHRKRTVWEESASYLALRKASLFILVVIAVPTIVYLVQNIQLTNEVGYGARISDVQYQKSGLSNALGIIASFASPVLLANFITRKEGERWQLVVTGIYALLYMMQGSRISVFVLLVIFVYVWYLCFSKRSQTVALMQILLIMLAVAVAFSFLSFARAAIESDVGSAFSNFADSNVLAEVLAEAGQTFSVTAKVIESVPDSVSQVNGATFLSGIVYIFPNGLTGNYYASVPSVDEVFAQQLVTYGGVGSSFIAEGWYNFGAWSLALFFVYGIIIAKLQNAAERSYRAGSCVAFFVCCASFMLMTFYVRSDTRTFLRNFFWDVLPVVVVQQVVEARQRNTVDNERRGAPYVS